MIKNTHKRNIQKTYNKNLSPIDKQIRPPHSFQKKQNILKRHKKQIKTYKTK